MTPQADFKAQSYGNLKMSPQSNFKVNPSTQKIRQSVALEEMKS